MIFQLVYTEFFCFVFIIGDLIFILIIDRLKKIQQERAQGEIIGDDEVKEEV